MQSFFSNKHAHCDSKTILAKKQEIATNTNEIVKKEALLVNNGQIAKTFNKQFAETVERLSAFVWPSNNEDSRSQNTLSRKIKIH